MSLRSFSSILAPGCFFCYVI
uniref:Uncharacterized protein n=1 Tax=Arundo donax TaxID=35708 RepID=A0A0A9H869_ARUDO